nr:hypothetical protein [Tannerella forsythia]
MRQMKAVTVLARTITMLQTNEPFMKPSMKPKMCSTRHLVLDFGWLFSF